ncbi:hypothetical protein HN014_01135 [Aquimarina sp. TRL1]|uniref:hypothetical protein n=1 Tax=Aquimarina sp. (strain TRL1) TaxID=2736252 RepID=UPI00158A2A09|nr:hypothetical protein [Aquimarina sp. TRL1]QKX03573.1 hypothetical protein HN014_01135 [Aquimarina sp. TRL1]
MKKITLGLFMTILGVNGIAQIKFEKGYYINNQGDKIDCLIKNEEWHDNPATIAYKISEDSSDTSLSINDFKSFKVGNQHYIRANVKIDRSGRDLSSLTENRSPEFTEETLLLKVLMKGKASLYLFREGNLNLYFFKKENNDIEQLIYKEYLIRLSDNTLNSRKVGVNNYFRQQLLNTLNCPDINEKDAANLDYKKKELVRYFLKYNRCKNEGFTYELADKIEKWDVNITVRPRISIPSISIEDRNYYLQNSTKASELEDFDTGVRFQFGVETEFVFPFYKNKWSIFLEPIYQSYQSEAKETRTNVLGTQNRKYALNYTSIEVPIGLRHYMYLNDQSSFFVSGAFVTDFDFNSSYKEIINERVIRETKVNSRSNIVVGLGYKYDRYSLEARLASNRKIAGFYRYSSISFIIGYTIF